LILKNRARPRFAAAPNIAIVLMTRSRIVASILLG
jgi:hypothetical protein